MKEMLVVGRGGEGVVVASQILADTFARAGYFVQSFPEFKAERRGAPISAFLRWDEGSPIRRRYKIADCDVLVSVSPSAPSPQAMAAVRPGGLVVLNHDTRFAHSGPFHVARVPASRIAREHGVLSSEGRPMGNVAVLGACVRLLLPHGLECLEQAIGARLGAARAEGNVAAAREGFARCTAQHRLVSDTPVEEAPPPPRWVPSAYPVSTMDSRVTETGTWSLERPVLLDACTACAVCALFCPDGAITRDNGSMAVDYVHCKGCGICVEVCPIRNAIVLEEIRT